MANLTRRDALASSAALAVVAAGASHAQTVSHSATAQVFENLAALRAAVLEPGQVVALLGYNTAGDGGAALWRIKDSGGTDPDDVCSLALPDARIATLAPQLRYDVRQAGIFAATSGPETSKRLLALVRHVVGAGGGEIVFGQSLRCDNVTFPAIPHARPVHFYMLAGLHIVPSNPKPGVFMWTFPSPVNGITGVSFENIRLWGRTQKGGRSQCNGIRIGSTNYMRVRNCSAHFIAGCGWQIESANNAEINITTFSCGTVAGVYAQSYIVSESRDVGCNDIVLQGTTEEDIHGINIEGAIIVRDGSALKLHGSEQSLRALRLHRCQSFALHVYASQRWKRDGFILITDAANSAGERMLGAEGDTGRPSRGRLTLDTMYNIRWGGAPRKHEGASAPGWCVIDTQNPASLVVLDGLVLGQSSSSDPAARYSYIRVAPGRPNLQPVDVTRLYFAKQVPSDRRVDYGARPAAAAPETLTAKGATLDLRGHRFADIQADQDTIIRDILLDPDTECTLCAPSGAVIAHSPTLRLANARDFTMGAFATLTIRQVGSQRIQEIARSPQAAR